MRHIFASSPSLYLLPGLAGARAKRSEDISLLASPISHGRTAIYDCVRIGFKKNHQIEAYVDGFIVLKGTVSRDFRIQVFYMDQNSPKPLIIPLGPFQIFSKFR